MNLKDIFGLTKRKILLLVILAILLNLAFGPFGILQVETTQGGYEVYRLGFPFTSNFLTPFGWNWDTVGLLGNVLVAYLISCLIFLK